MTKKHFIALADAMRKTKPRGVITKAVAKQWQDDLNAIVKVCHVYGERFDEGKFRDYIAKNEPLAFKIGTE